MNNVNCRLPKPSRKPPTARVVSALRRYDRLFEGSLRRRRARQALLVMLLDEMTKQELADYYAAVQARLKAQPTVEWPEGYDEV